MRREFQLLAGASAVAAAIAIATQFNRPEPVEAPPPVAQQIPPLIAAQITVGPDDGSASAPELDLGPELAAEITQLTATLHDREAELARLQATLTQRDTDLARTTAALEARNDEIKALRQELESLRTQTTFDAKMAELKTAAARPAAEPDEAPPPVPARLERPHDSVDDSLLTEIQFETASSTLTPGAHMRTLAAAATLSAMQYDRIRVVGHADTVGNPAANRSLSSARADTVTELLVKSGLPRNLIDTTGMGEVDTPIATGDGIAEPLNRAVSIIVVPTRLAYAMP